MSYENPEQFVDKQSGQHFRRMQESITKAATSTIASYVDTYKRNQIKIQKIREQADKEALDAKNAVFQTASKNSTIQFQNINGKFKRLAELKKKNPSMLTDKERNFIRYMDTIGTRMYSALENTTASSLAFKEQSSIKPGSQGSNDEFRNPDQYNTMMIMNGKIPGRKEASYEEDENGNVVYSVKVYDGKGKFVGDVINKNIEETMFIDKVPNLQPDINKAIEKAKAILNIESEFSPAYIKDGELTGKLMVGVNNKGVGVSADLWEKTLKEQVELIAIGLDHNEKSSFHNNITRTKNTKDDKGNIVKDDFSTLWEYDQDLTSEQNTNFSQELLRYANSEVESVKAKNKVMRKAKESITPPKKISAADKLYNDQVELANTSVKDMDELMKTPLKEIRNRKFTMDEQGAFIQVINRHRSKADGKVQTMEDIKADFIREEGEDAWDEENYTAELGYVKESGGKKIIVQLPVGSYEQKTETLVDLLYPNLKTTRRNKMLNIIRGNEGEITLDRSELP